MVTERVSQRAQLPEGLEQLPPGKELALVLFGIERTRLNGYDVLTLLQARARQVAYDQAGLCADMVDMDYCPNGSADSPADRKTCLAPTSGSVGSGTST